MRQERDRISEEIMSLSTEEIIKYFEKKEKNKSSNSNS